MNPVLGPVTKSRRGKRVETLAPATTVRCAIYTRKSTNEGLDSDWTSLDVQRSAAEAFVVSQGWDTLPDRYDDGGFSGGNLERPALQRLMADIDAGLVDCVVVHKIDRLSRSLLDFVRIAELFEARKIGLVSVTQQISTTTSAGRLMLNVLFSFAQFEREIIGERTSAAMCASRRKGKWMGGPAVLGYSADRENKRLVVNPSEVPMVRELFDLYLQHRSLIDVCRVVNNRGWTTKTILYKNGRHKDGVAWNKARLYDILANVTYIGKVAHKGELYDGEQDGIVNERVFAEVQKILQHNSQNGGATAKNKHGALLRGLLKCGNCGAAMAHTYAKKGQHLYRYYMCLTKMKRGADACPAESLPAQEIEDFVVDQIRKLARDPELVKAVYEEVISQQKNVIAQLQDEKKRLQKQLLTCKEEAKRLVSAIGERPVSAITGRLSEIETQAALLEVRISQIEREASEFTNGLSVNAVAGKLAEFEGVWEVMDPTERVGLINGLIHKVVCNGDGSIQVVVRSSAST